MHTNKASHVPYYIRIRTGCRTQIPPDSYACITYMNYPSTETTFTDPFRGNFNAFRSEFGEAHYRFRSAETAQNESKFLTTIRFCYRKILSPKRKCRPVDGPTTVHPYARPSGSLVT